jgi:hypothetical protein
VVAAWSEAWKRPADTLADRFGLLEPLSSRSQPLEESPERLEKSSPPLE